MKNQNLTLVLMAGLPGAGKSTLAIALGNILNWRVIDKDMYKKEFLMEGLDNENAGRKAYEKSFAIALDVLTKGQESVILDSAALHQFILDEVRSIEASVANVHLKVILCIVERNLRNHRLRNRPWQEATVQANPETIADYLALFKHLPSDRLILYTDKSLEESLETAKMYLDGLLE